MGMCFGCLVAKMISRSNHWSLVTIAGVLNNREISHFFFECLAAKVIQLEWKMRFYWSCWWYFGDLGILVCRPFYAKVETYKLKERLHYTIEILIGCDYCGDDLQVSTCSTCSGAGKIVTENCRRCAGSGQIMSKRAIKVVFPRGVNDGFKLRLQGEGNFDRTR